jgi:thioredoxin 1
VSAATSPTAGEGATNAPQPEGKATVIHPNDAGRGSKTINSPAVIRPIYQGEFSSMSEHVKDVSDSSFEADVLKSDRPVLVDFWAQWCAPCRMLAPTVEAVAEKYAGSAAVVKLNVDDNPAVSQRYGIKGIPTLILFKNGKEEERVVGATSKEAISRMIDKHVQSGAASA